MDLNHNLIVDCPLCELFLNPEKNINTKLYYPDLDKINEVDFIILHSSIYKTPVVIVRDHTTEISSEVWGRILYQVRKMFGNVQLRSESSKIKDHFHCVIVQDEGR